MSSELLATYYYGDWSNRTQVDIFGTWSPEGKLEGFELFLDNRSIIVLPRQCSDLPTREQVRKIAGLPAEHGSNAEQPSASQNN